MAETEMNLFVRAFALLVLLVPAGLAAQVPSAPELAARGYILVDHHSGKVLAAKNDGESLDPASITKLMTAYAVFRALSDGQITLADQVPISETAWRTPGSRMFIEVNTRVSVEELLQGMIVQSGNDASVALAEYIAGTETVFAQLMTQYAREIGMTNTTYKNSTGLPAKGHQTTAADIARLATMIVTEYPQYYAWYSQREFTYNGITQKNRNALLWRDPSVDGMKTGMTDAAGYCLVSSAKQDGMRLIAVVMGTDSEAARARESQKLLSYGFRFYETYEGYGAGDVLDTPAVWMGAANQVRLGLEEDLILTVPKDSQDQLKASMSIRPELRAPIREGEQYGTLTVTLADETVAQRPLVALENVEEAGFFAKIWDHVVLFFKGLFS